MDKVKQDIVRFVDIHASALLEVSHAIHANPELAFKEYAANATLTRALEDHDVQVNSNVYGLETAFEAELTGNGGPSIDILAEYDALPGIGHACGHNIIATSALGAFLALKSIDGALGGSVRVLGTPAEERGGGKEVMARNGAFDKTDAAIMMHPAGINLATMPCICVAEVRAVYQGRSAHASAMPHRGINALDGLLLAYQAISNLRQHIQHTERIHGIITEGGQAPNIVPDRATGEFYVRAADANELESLKPRVQACFEAGARGSGSDVEIAWGDVDYLDLNTNWPLAESFQRNAEALGRDFFPHEKLGGSGAGSTDMGNVSHRVPSIHPMLAAAPPNVVIHNPEFETWAGSEMGDQAALDGAKALAMTALDFLDDSDLQQASQKAFDVSKGLT